MSIKKIVVYIVIIVVVIMGIFIINKYVIQQSGPLPSISPSPTESAQVSPSTSIGPSGSPTSTPVSDAPPKCWLTGEIVYDGSVFVHIGAKEFNYSDTYDPHDLIKWQISPSGETFSIGPNRTSGLKLPYGSDNLTISFNGSTPKYKKYDLTASIDYVAVVNNAAKILNVKCTGKSTLVINK